MPHRKKSKKNKHHRTRGNSGCKIGCIRDPRTKEYYDLNVLLPDHPNVEVSVRLVQLQNLLDRLEFLGYSTIALVHQVRARDDISDVKSCEDVFNPYRAIIEKKEKNNNMKIKYRLHYCMLEKKSDLATLQNNDVVNSYDIVSIAPQNEDIFQAACSSSTIDIITLDYFTTGRGLPYKMRILDHIQSALQHKVAFEILYGPSINDMIKMNNRKFMLQTIRAMDAVSLGRDELNIMVASGTSNPMVLRSPGDIANLFEVVGRFRRSQLEQANAAEEVLHYAWRRRVNHKGGLPQDSGIQVTGVRIVDSENKDSDDEANDEPAKGSSKKETIKKRKIDDSEQASSNDLGDDFIKF